MYDMPDQGSHRDRDDEPPTMSFTSRPKRMALARNLQPDDEPQKDKGRP